jgi:cellulose 1,4-beta-cellobiosidase
VSLTWTAAGGAQAYNLYRGTASNGETQLAPGIAGTSYVDTAVTNGTTYYYKIAGTNANGEGALSNEVNATPNAAPVPPAAPSNLTATGGSQRVTLNWVNHATTATGIAIERKQNPNQPFTQIATVAPASTTYVDTSAKKRTTYYYRIRTMNGTLVSPYSNTASATTLP